jgi:hypothetical protein
LAISIPDECHEMLYDPEKVNVLAKFVGNREDQLPDCLEQKIIDNCRLEQAEDENNG